MFDDHEERSLVAQEDRDDLPFENIVRSVSSLTDHLDEQLRFATEDDIIRRIGNEIIGNLDEDGYLRAELAGDRRALQGRGGARSRRCSRSCRASIRPAWPRATCRSACSSSSRADPNPDPVSVEIVGRALRRPEPAPLPGHRARAQAAPRPDHGIGRGDHGPRAEARPALRRQRLALHRARRGRPQDGRRLRRRPERGRHPAPARELALPLAAAQLRATTRASTWSRSSARRCG